MPNWRRAGGSGVTSSPPTRMRPRSGVSKPAIRRSAVVLPLPLGPSSARISPFSISREVCSRGHQPVVSLKIYNVLVQMVAIPVLADGSAERLDSLRLRCGEYQAYWDGKYLDGRREAVPGIYYYQLSVDGERYTRKMIARGRVTNQP